MLKKYTKADFQLLKKWVTDAEILFQFSGPDWKFPIKEEVIDEHIFQFPHRQFYIGYSNDNQPYAFGQIIWNETNAPRIGRLLVGEPHQRGKGLGQQFVKELIEECLKIQPDQPIHLFVAENNIPAIKCYEKVGFRFNNDTHFTLNHKGQKIDILKMTLGL